MASLRHMCCSRRTRPNTRSSHRQRPSSSMTSMHRCGLGWQNQSSPARKGVGSGDFFHQQVQNTCHKTKILCRQRHMPTWSLICMPWPHLDQGPLQPPISRKDGKAVQGVVRRLVSQEETCAFAPSSHIVCAVRPLCDGRRLAADSMANTLHLQVQCQSVPRRRQSSAHCCLCRRAV